MNDQFAAAARSWLFVPGNRQERFAKAAASGTDVVLLDLEDAVSIQDKEAARAHAVEWLTRGGSAAVRVNPTGTSYHRDDLAALVGLPGLLAVLLPKASSPDDVARLYRELGGEVALVPQIESAAGLMQAPELAAVDGVVRLAFGHLDYAVDIDASPTDVALAWARSVLVVTSRAAGLAGPVDSVTTELDNVGATSQDAQQARSLGFTGKLCIHPRQVAAVNEAMRPTADQVVWARRVLSAGTVGATPVGGQMVDAPVLARAERIVKCADR